MKRFLSVCAGLLLTACQSPVVPSPPANANPTPVAATPTPTPTPPPGPLQSCLQVGHHVGEVFQVQQFRINCQYTSPVDIQGLVQDQKTQAGLADVKVTIQIETDGVRKDIGSAVSDAQGRYDLGLSPNFEDSKVHLKLEKSGYKTLEHSFGFRYKYSSTAPASPAELKLQLEPLA